VCACARSAVYSRFALLPISCISQLHLSSIALWCSNQAGSEGGYKTDFQAEYQAGFRLGSDKVFKCQQALQWTLYCYNSHVVNTGIPPFLATSLIEFHWMDCRWRLTAHCADVHGKLAMSSACTQVHIVQAMVNLYFCWCIISPHNEIHTLFIPALGYMYLCWALLIHAICVVPQGCVFCQILSPYSYASWARVAPSRIPFQCCKMYSGMLKIGLQPFRSTESRLKMLGYITGSRVSHWATLLLLLWSQFLSPCLFCTIMSLNRNNQQSGWIVYLVYYSLEYR
jgi:hypothetical protein